MELKLQEFSRLFFQNLIKGPLNYSYMGLDEKIYLW